MSVIVIMTNHDVATHDNATDWTIEPDGVLTIIDEALEPIAIYNAYAWTSATRTP